MPDTAEIAVTTDDPVVARVVGRVVEEVSPLRVVMFGSRAKGSARPDSDIDLVVVMPDGTRRRETAKALYVRVECPDVPVDYVVTTPSALAQHADDIGLIYPEIVRTGRDVYVNR